MNLRNFCVVLATVTFCAVFIGCFIENMAGSTTTENTNKPNTISGRLVYKDGDPAQNVSVKILSADHNPTGGLAKKSDIFDIIKTNRNGEFSSDSLPAGLYNVMGEKNGMVSFIDSVEASGDDATVLEDDTLKSPGSVSGIVRLQPFHSSTSVFVFVFGTDRITAAKDSIGNFTLSNLAEGTYHVRLFSTLDDYKSFDTALTVISGKAEALNDTIRLEYTGIPLVKGLELDYDTSWQIVTLSWNPGDPSLVKGYNVHRRHIDSGFTNVPLNKVLITDTVFSDSSALQDQTYEYKVVAVDHNDNEGFKSNGVRTKISTYFVLDTIYGGAVSEQQFYRPNDIAIAENGDVYIVERDNYQVKVFNHDMEFKFTLLKVDTPSVNRPSPDRITLDSIDNAYIALDSNILVFDSNAIIIDTIRLEDNVNDLDVKDDELYLVRGTDSIVIISLESKSTRFLKGLLPDSRFIRIEISDDGRIFAVDNYNGVIQIYDTSGDRDSILLINGDPSSIAYHENKLYVNYYVENLGIKMMVFDDTGNVLADFKHNYYSSGISGIAIDSEGSIYLTLYSIHKIAKLNSLLP